MKSLRFLNEIDAMQHLADITQSKIVIAAEKIEGGMADFESIQSIANKHGVSPADIQNELSIGQKIELEHTDDPEMASEIAMDHLYEISDYYTRLEQMEEEAKKEEKDKNNE